LALRIFATKSFGRFCRRERVDDLHLCEAIERAERGLIDADLGSGLIKQRVARVGQGRSGGFRVLLAYQPRIRAAFLYGFAKSERGNVDGDELARLRRAASEMLSWNNAQIGRLLAAGEWREIKSNDEEEQD